jgi:hypothetical protein
VAAAGSVQCVTMPDPVVNHPTPGMHLWGWMEPAELQWLGAQAAAMASVVEVGSLHGRSSFALAASCGHDYLHADYPDVRAVVDELLPGVVLVAGTSIWATWGVGK